MASPLKSDIHIDVALSNISVRYSNDQLVGEKLFPPIPTDKDSNKWFVYGTENLRTFGDDRAPGNAAQEVEWTVSTSSFSTSEHALSDYVPDEIRNNADAPLNINVDTTEMLTDMILLRHEYSVATTATTTSNYGNSQTKDLSAAGNKQWDDFTGSDPLEDVRSARSTIHSQIMRNPNLMIIGKQVFEALKNHPKILERIKYSQLGIVTTDLLEALFEVDEVVVAGAVYQNSTEGATKTTAYVWGKNVILAYNQPNAGVKSLTFGKTFRKVGFRQTRTWRDDRRKADAIEVADKYAIQVVVNTAGFLFQNVIA